MYNASLQHQLFKPITLKMPLLSTKTVLMVNLKIYKRSPLLKKKSAKVINLKQASHQIKTGKIYKRKN